MFLPFFCLTVFSILFNWRELIWNIDGLNQYYPFFVYEGKWIRGIVASLFGGQGLQIPLWEWCSGYGVDVPTTFDVFLDPLNLVSAITPGPLTEWVFQLLVVLRLYLAGLSFIFYCRTRSENKTGMVLGALLYALSGSALTGVQWASGLHALVLFPAILAGAERILAGKPPWTFIASLSLLAIISYYFTYMALILLIGYLAIRVVMLERPHLTPQRFLEWTLRFAALVVMCLLIAGFAIVPALSALLGMDRFVDTQTIVPLFYDFQYYMARLTDFLSVTSIGSDCFIGFGGMAFLGCLLLFSQKHRNRELKIILVIFALFMLLPCVGSLFNALNYATNRWVWAFSFAMSFALVRMVPLLLQPTEQQTRLLIRGTVLYALVLLVPVCRTEANVAGMAALVGVLFMVVAWRNPQTRRSALACGLCLTLAINGLYFLDAYEGGVSNTLVPLGDAYNALTSKSVEQIATGIDDPSWWRYDSSQTVPRLRNNSLVQGTQSIDFYNSVYNGKIDAFHTELGLVGADTNFIFYTLQSRSDLMALLGIRYNINNANGTDPLPYGYDANNVVGEGVARGITYNVTRSEDALPVGVAFDKALTRNDYLSLPMAQRQQALLQAVVLDDATDQSVAKEGAGATFTAADDLSYEDQTLPYTVAAASNAVVDEGRITANVAGASVTLSFEGVPQADTYVYLTNLNYQPQRPSTLLSEEEKSIKPWYTRVKLMLDDFMYVSPTAYSVYAQSNLCPRAANITNSVRDYHMYGGKDSWLACVGYNEDAPTQITLSFSQAGTYTFDQLQVVAETHHNQKEWLTNRQANALQDVSLGCNQLTGSIDLDSSQTLLLTVAYSKGWSAWVDGEPWEIRVGDTGFMALDLPAGHHNIELRYHTIGLVEGFAVTGVGLVSLALYAVGRRLWQKRSARV